MKVVGADDAGRAVRKDGFRDVVRDAQCRKTGANDAAQIVVDPPAPRGKRDEVWDSRVTGFGIRISDTKDADPARRGKAGKITFILFTRFAPGAAPARRTIGVYGSDAMRLEDARRIAGEWRSQVARGIEQSIQARSIQYFFAGYLS
jgi:hypothetical protein